MNAAERQLVEDKALRDEARALFNSRLGRVRLALSSRGVGQRIGEGLLGSARKAGTQGADVAREERWVIAGVLALLIAWFARGPITRTGRRLTDWVTSQTRKPEPRATVRRCLRWIERKVKP